MYVVFVQYLHFRILKFPLNYPSIIPLIFCLKPYYINIYMDHKKTWSYFNGHFRNHSGYHGLIKTYFRKWNLNDPLQWPFHGNIKHFLEDLRTCSPIFRYISYISHTAWFSPTATDQF